MDRRVRDPRRRPGPSEFDPPPNGPVDNSERYAEERHRMFEDEIPQSELAIWPGKRSDRINDTPDTCPLLAEYRGVVSLQKFTHLL